MEPHDRPALRYNDDVTWPVIMVMAVMAVVAVVTVALVHVRLNVDHAELFCIVVARQNRIRIEAKRVLEELPAAVPGVDGTQEKIDCHNY